jgi:hypothetical protein
MWVIQLLSLSASAQPQSPAQPLDLPEWVSDIKDPYRKFRAEKYYEEKLWKEYLQKLPTFQERLDALKRTTDWETQKLEQFLEHKKLMTHEIEQKQKALKQQQDRELSSNPK